MFLRKSRANFCKQRCHHAWSHYVGVWCVSYYTKPKECKHFFKPPPKRKGGMNMNDYYKNCNKHGDRW
jgi:hypothetical protein